MTNSAEIFFKTNQMDQGVKHFKSALEQANKLYPRQPQVARVLNNLGVNLHRAGKYGECLQYLKDAKEILDNHIEERYLTLKVLHHIGASYHYLGRFLLAFQFYKDALDTVDKTMISGESYKTLCKSMSAAMMQLSPTSLRQAFVLLKKKVPSLNDICQLGFNHFYGFCLLYIYFELDINERLKTLEKIRKSPRCLNHKYDGRVVLIFLLLSMTYGEMGSFDKSRSCYKEAKDMAKSLPTEDDSILPEELGMIELMKKEGQ